MVPGLPFFKIILFLEVRLRIGSPQNKSTLFWMLCLYCVSIRIGIHYATNSLSYNFWGFFSVEIGFPFVRRRKKNSTDEFHTFSFGAEHPRFKCAPFFLYLTKTDFL